MRVSVAHLRSELLHTESLAYKPDTICGPAQNLVKLSTKRLAATAASKWLSPTMQRKEPCQKHPVESAGLDP